jgi:hypothetical protein
MRIWFYISAEMPLDGELYYFRLTNNEYYPHLLPYWDSVKGFGLTDANILYPLNQVLKFTPETP